MHQNATVAKWYEENGRHEIFARGKEVELTEKVHDMVLNPIDLTRPNKPEMEGPKTAHEEAVMMRKLYQEIVLKKQLDTKEADKPVQIQSLSRKKKEIAEPALV
jgi:tRNA(Ser,Leu) C12 N-acetylase TAN1